MGTKSVRARLNQQRIDMGLPTVDYANLHALESPPEILELQQQMQEESEFVVEESEAELQGIEAEVAAESEGHQALEYSKEALFVENTERPRV